MQVGFLIVRIYRTRVLTVRGSGSMTSLIYGTLLYWMKREGNADLQCNAITRIAPQVTLVPTLIPNRYYKGLKGQIFLIVSFSEPRTCIQNVDHFFDSLHLQSFDISLLWMHFQRSNYNSESPSRTLKCPSNLTMGSLTQYLAPTSYYFINDFRILSFAFTNRLQDLFSNTV